MLSEQAEIAPGNQTNQKVLKQYIIYDNPPLQRYVRRVGNKLAAQSHRFQSTRPQKSMKSKLKSSLQSERCNPQVTTMYNSASN